MKNENLVYLDMMLRQYSTNEDVFRKILGVSEPVRCGILFAYYACREQCDFRPLTKFRGTGLHIECARIAKDWYPDRDRKFLGQVTRVLMALSETAEYFLHNKQ